MLQAVLNAMLVCHHRRTTFPVTPRRAAAAALPRTYIVCLDCGRELAYDWIQMRVIPPRVPAGAAPLEPCESIHDRPVAVRVDKVSAHPPIGRVPPAAVLPPVTRPAGDRLHAAGGGGQYLVRARLRMRQVQVVLGVLNTLMTGMAAQPDDVARLKYWADPSHQSCSTRKLARRVVECAASR